MRALINDGIDRSSHTRDFQSVRYDGE